MKNIKILLVVLAFAGTARGQSFSNTDSLREYINKYIRTSPTTAFTNLRLNTAMLGLANWIDTMNAKITGGVRNVDTLYRVNDSTIGYKISGTQRTIQILGSVTGGTGGGGGVVTETDPLSPHLASTYANPSWITSLAYSKLTGTPTIPTTTTQISEGTNLYHTTARARGAISAGYAISYNSTTGVVTSDTATLSTLYTTTFYRDGTIKGSGTQASPLGTGSIHIVTDANYTVAADDLTVVFSTQSATRTLTLPTASTSMNRVIHIKASSTNTVTLSIAVKTIGGSTFTSVSTSGELSIQSDGVDWWAFRKSF